MLALMCIWVTGMAAVTLLIENMLGWLIFSSPGWANGFPFGLSFQAALSVGLASYSLLILMSATAGLGAFMGFIRAISAGCSSVPSCWHSATRSSWAGCTAIRCSVIHSRPVERCPASW